MTTEEEFDNSQESLHRQITGLKKQSTLALLLALVMVIFTAYLLISLKSSNTNLTNSRNELKAMKDSIQNLNVQMNEWRESLLLKKQQESTTYQSEIRYSVAPPPPPIPAQSSSTPTESVRSPSYSYKTKNEGEFFGYIIYIQDYKNSKVSDKLHEEFTQQGAIAPRIEHIGNSKKFGNAIKYFHPNEQKAAENIRQQVMETLKSSNITDVNMQLNYIENDKVPAGQFEIWINQ